MGEFLNAPIIVQSEIKKAYELRIIVFGNDVVSYKIDSQAQQHTSLDWRNGEKYMDMYSLYDYKIFTN